jgi:hypothetical protein
MGREQAVAEHRAEADGLLRGVELSGTSRLSHVDQGNPGSPGSGVEKVDQTWQEAVVPDRGASGSWRVLFTIEPAKRRSV